MPTERLSCPEAAFFTAGCVSSAPHATCMRAQHKVRMVEHRAMCVGGLESP